MKGRKRSEAREAKAVPGTTGQHFNLLITLMEIVSVA